MVHTFCMQLRVDAFVGRMKRVVKSIRFRCEPRDTLGNILFISK